MYAKRGVSVFVTCRMGSLLHEKAPRDQYVEEGGPRV